MVNRKRGWVAGMLLLTSLVLAWGAAVAQDAPAADSQTIVAVRVEGNTKMTTNAILALVKTRVAHRYDEQVSKDDQRRLLATGKFKNVVVVTADTAQGVVVTFVVTPRDTVAALLIRGNKHFKTDDIYDALSFGAGDPLDLNRITTGRTAIEDKYKEDGFYYVAVTVERSDGQVVYVIREGPRIRVKSIQFKTDGSRSYSSWTLRQKVKTRRGYWIFTRGHLDAQQVARDVVELRNFYRGEGYLDAEVDKELSFSADKRKVRVIFHIDEGPRYRISEVRFEGNAIFSARELRPRLKMTRGEYFSALDLRRDTDRVRDTYGEIGYLEANVLPRTIYVDPEAPTPPWLELAPGEKPGLVIIVYKIDESDPFTVGRITIRGNSLTEERVIRRQLRFYPEQLYNTVAVADSERRLMESRLFGNATITPYGQEPGVRNALVTVEEGKTTEFIVGAGFSTNSGILGSISLTQRNFSWHRWPESWSDLFSGRAFKGGGQYLRISLEPGTEIMRARIDWREPYLFDRPISLGVGVYLFSRERESYDEGRVGAQVSLGKEFPNRWYGEVAVRVEDIRVDSLESDAPPEVMADRGDHLQLGIQGTIVRDRTDSRWQPSIGDRVSLSVEQVVGDDNFMKSSADYTHYWTVYLDSLDRKHILAARVRGDAVIAGDAPVFDRYYGGGLGDVRGFAFRGISPRSAGTDEPIGGDVRAYAGSEYSFPVVGEQLRSVVFLDTGTVEDDCSITTWRASAGFGVRLLIPYFGPVPMSLDFAFPLSKDDQDDTQLISFSFGWVF